MIDPLQWRVARMYLHGDPGHERSAWQEERFFFQSESDEPGVFLFFGCKYIVGRKRNDVANGIVCCPLFHTLCTIDASSQAAPLGFHELDSFGFW